MKFDRKGNYESKAKWKDGDYVESRISPKEYFS